MQNKVLYSRSTTLPNIRGHFHRTRIDKLLHALLGRHLIVVGAGAGSGKTHAVSGFLHGARARVFWLQLSELDNNITRFWEEFIYVMASQNKETAAWLEQLGFPETLSKYDAFLHILARDIYSREQVVFVFDDFHLIHDEAILRFVQNLIFARLENFCIIINTRTTVSFDLTGMFANDLAGRITAEDLYFTRHETEEYLRGRGISLTHREIEKVQTFTEGWPLALYLVELSIKKGGIVSKDPIAGAIPLIFDMIEKEMFSKYAPQVQDFLVEVSLLDSFPEGVVKALAGEHFDSILEHIDKNMFINYNHYTECYNFHHIFLRFLNGKQKYLTQQNRDDAYLRAADWCAANGKKLEALDYYDKCGRYDKIMDIIIYDHPNDSAFTKTSGDFYLNIMDKIPDELKKKNPLFYVNHAGLLLNNAEIQPAIRELLETQAELEALPLTEENKYVLGNVYFMLGLVSIASGNYDFVELMKKASDYLPGGGFAGREIGPINTKYAIMLSSPEPGELKKMEDALFAGMPCASKAMNGYGYGMEYLASAEAAYFTGDMKKAAKNAYEAVYKAREMQIEDVASNGYFLLMRIEAASGNYTGVTTQLEQFRAYIRGIERKFIFSEMLDVAESWFYIMTGQLDKVALWIIGDTTENVLAPFSMGMERLIKAKYLLKKGRYYELLAWLSQSEELFRRYNMWLILLDIFIYKSVASYYIQDEAGAFAALREAYEIAHGNNLVTQFTEHGNDIRVVIYNARNHESNAIPDAWLDEIYTKAATYEKHLRNMKEQHHQISGQPLKPSVKVTKREKEMLGYLCQGLTNAEIASKCFITISAVKKTLNNIYLKLDATNRADAVRTALQMEWNG